MFFLHFIQLVRKNLLWLTVIPFAIAGSVFYFTRYEKKVYSSESVIYTGIASGYNLAGNNKADFFATNNAFDNLLSLISSRETKKEVLLRLLATHLPLQKHVPSMVTWDAYDHLRKEVPDSVRRQVVKPTPEATMAALEEYMNGYENNVIYRIINSDDPYYSLKAIENVKALRINNSDLIKISYQSNDPMICKYTLELLEAVFMAKHRGLKEGQSESVVGYFEAETRLAQGRLSDAESNFMQFNKENDIINYYEQTRAVAIEKENLDVQNHNMTMDKMATSKSLGKVNESLKGRLYQDEYGSQVIRERDQLSEVYTKIAVNEVIGKSDANYAQQMDSLQQLSARLEKRLDGAVNNLYAQTQTPYGIPTKNVLDEWLKTTLQFEQSKARLEVMDDRKKQFKEEYRKYAPLGAMLKKIERQINVSEQEYLELLHGLNMAKLTQQNNELTSKLNVVDPPYLPMKPNPSKRILLVLGGFVAGFVLILAFIIARAMVNRTIQQPGKAAKLVGIPLTGIYPLLNSPKSFVDKAGFRLVQQLLARVDTRNTPVTLGIMSIQPGEGKSTIAALWEEQLVALNYKVSRRQWNALAATGEAEGDIVLIELPALDNLVIKPGLLPALDHTFLVCRANRVWSRVDKELLGIFTKATDCKPSLVLNGVKVDFAEEYIGEVKKKRFFLAAFVKRLAKFEFGHRSAIS